MSPPGLSILTTVGSQPMSWKLPTTAQTASGSAGLNPFRHVAHRDDTERLQRGQVESGQGAGQFVGHEAAPIRQCDDIGPLSHRNAGDQPARGQVQHRQRVVFLVGDERFLGARGVRQQQTGREQDPDQCPEPSIFAFSPARPVVR